MWQPLLSEFRVHTRRNHAHCLCLRHKELEPGTCREYTDETLLSSAPRQHASSIRKCFIRDRITRFERQPIHASPSAAIAARYRGRASHRAAVRIRHYRLSLGTWFSPSCVLITCKFLSCHFEHLGRFACKGLCWQQTV
jgi:hypothetical protein